MCLCVYLFCMPLPLEAFEVHFENCYMVGYLSAWSGIVILCTGSFHCDVSFWYLINFWNHMGLRFWCVRFYLPKFYFLVISLSLGVTAEFLLGWFLFICWVHLLEFLWVWIHDRHLQMFCIGEWLWLGCIIYLGFFLVQLLELLLVWPSDWLPWRYCWEG